MNKAMKLFLFALSDNNSENEKKEKKRKLVCSLFRLISYIHAVDLCRFTRLFFSPEVLQFPVMHFFNPQSNYGLCILYIILDFIFNLSHCSDKLKVMS